MLPPVSPLLPPLPLTSFISSLCLQVISRRFPELRWLCRGCRSSAMAVVGSKHGLRCRGKTVLHRRLPAPPAGWRLFAWEGVLIITREGRECHGLGNWRSVCRFCVREEAKGVVALHASVVSHAKSDKSD